MIDIALNHLTGSSCLYKWMKCCGRHALLINVKSDRIEWHGKKLDHFIDMA